MISRWVKPSNLSLVLNLYLLHLSVALKTIPRNSLLFDVPGCFSTSSMVGLTPESLREGGKLAVEGVLHPLRRDSVIQSSFRAEPFF